MIVIGKNSNEAPNRFLGTAGYSQRVTICNRHNLTLRSKIPVKHAKDVKNLIDLCPRQGTMLVQNLSEGSVESLFEIMSDLGLQCFVELISFDEALFSTTATIPKRCSLPCILSVLADMGMMASCGFASVF
jgi:hypothetical protein